MPGISLEKLLARKGGVGSILAALARDTRGSFAIENRDGRQIYGGAGPLPGQRFPIELDGSLLGWARGDASAALAADILTQAARLEDEKKSLVGELAERYREISLLYRLSERLAASPQPEAVSEIALEEVRRLIRADSGAILLLAEDDRLQAAAAFGPPRPEIQRGGLLQRVIETGKAELAGDIAAAGCPDSDPGCRVAVLAAPLKTDRRRLGAIFLSGSQSFTAGDLKLINMIAMQIAPALEISRLYQESIEKARIEQELKTARRVQEGLLPQDLPGIPGWEIATRWRPAREVSGDFYDVVVGNGPPVDLVIADVTDKGMPASLFMAFTRSILRISIYGGEDPERIIASVNQSICRDSYDGLFTTLVYTRLDPRSGQLTYVNAGHNPPLLFHASAGNFETLNRTGLTLGVDLDAPYHQKTAQMEVGDFLLFYTDGITEAVNARQEEFGIERLKQQARLHQGCDIETILDSLEAAVLDFTSPGSPADDMTMMALRRVKTPGGDGPRGGP